jgi:hypothetical protein
MSDGDLYTAAELAHVIACTAQNIRKQLGDRRPDGEKRVSGMMAAAWQFGSIPSPIMEKLTQLASRHGYSTPLQLLQNLPKRATVPRLTTVSDTEIGKAQKLQRAFAICFLQPAETPIAELARMAAPGYQREFGRKISDRHLRDLITKILRRDRGDRNFERLDLYLSERPSSNASKPSPLAVAFRLNELDQAFATVRDRANPTLSEIAFCWREVVKVWADRIAAGADEIKLKQQLRGYILHSAPFLGDTAAAVKRNLNRKIRGAVERGIDTIVDGRLQPNRTKGKPSDFDAMIKLLAQHSIFHCGGRESQAYRQLHMGTAHNSDRFSEDFRAAYPFDCRRAKSRMPNSVRNAVRPMIEATKAIHLGPRAARLAMPSIRRDWSAVLAGASYTSDDVTLNRYVYDWHEDGEYEFDGRRFNVIRPQFLPVVDERTGNPLGFSLAPAPTYNSWQIRTLMTRICMRPEIGLPFERFLFELGVWNSRNVQALVGWALIDESFERHGICLSVRHATTPKAKIIEQVIGALQNLDEYAPGYIGRGEQRVKYEGVQKFLLTLKRVGQPLKQAVNPAELLMSKDECADMLSEVLQRFADEPQNGERLDGLSPAEGWLQLSGGRAHQVLPETLRFVLGTEESEPTVGSEGIRLRIGNRWNYYFGSDRLGELVGEKVRVRYNPEFPEQVVVSHLASDPHGLQPFAVPLFQRVPASGATADEFRSARDHQARFTSYGRALYRELTPKSNLTVCHSEIGSPELRAAGEANNRLERDCIELNSERETERGEIKQLAARLNLDIDPAKSRRPVRQAKYLRSIAERKAKIQALEQTEASL